MAIMGDTQYMSRELHDGTKTMLADQITWILNNRVDSTRGNIELVIQVGDATDTTSGCTGYAGDPNNCTADQRTEMNNFRAEWNRLDDIIPYFVIGGNHDWDDYLSDKVGYDYHVAAGRTWPTSVNAGAGGFDDSWAAKVPFGGANLLVIGLDYETSGTTWAAATNTWAQARLDADPNTPAIVVTHNIDVDTAADLPDFLTDTQVQFVAMGHFAGTGGGFVNTSQWGSRDVHFMHHDEQFDVAGGNAWLHMVCFDPANNTKTAWMQHPSGAIYAGYRFEAFDPVFKVSPADELADSAEGLTALTATHNWGTGAMVIDAGASGWWFDQDSLYRGGYLASASCLKAFATGVRYDGLNECLRVRDNWPELIGRSVGFGSLFITGAPSATTPVGTAALEPSWGILSRDSFSWSPAVDLWFESRGAVINCDDGFVSDPWTLAFWFEPSQEPDLDDYYFDCEDGLGNGFRVYNSGADTMTAELDGVAVNWSADGAVGTAVHYIVQWDSTTDAITVYANGALQGTSGAATSLTGPNTDFHFGSNGTEGKSALGYYKDVIMLSTACNDACRRYLMLCGVADTAAGATRSGTYGNAGAVQGPPESTATACTGGGVNPIPHTPWQRAGGTVFGGAN